VIVLGIDTSGYVNAVGLVDGGRILADMSFPARTDSLEQIVDNIDSALKSAGLRLADVQGLGVGLGPGSWTGIRVGVTVAKILAFSTGKPVVGIPTLAALAFSARHEASLLCPVIAVGTADAVYAGLYRSADNTVTRIGDYYIGDVTGLVPLITEPCAIIGSDVKSIVQTISPATDLKVKAVEAAPSGASVAALALPRLEKGTGDDPLSLTPLYLKESTAKAFVNKYSQRIVPFS
jgi:tRNA threonylcarbamoyladenosine biosynthesis protein TsaB